MRNDLGRALFLSASLFAALPAYAGFDEGLSAYMKSDFVAALKELRPLAEGGNAKAQYYLGAMYQNGQGLERDNAKALRWYRKSAEQNNAMGQNAVGSMYFSGLGVAQDDKSAALYYRKAAEQGMPEAQFNMAEMLLLGRGVAADSKKAAEMFRKAALQGIGPAQTQLGLMYYEGSGVAQDDGQAADWFLKAAAQGFRDPRGNLERFGRWFLMTLMHDGKPASLALLTDDRDRKARLVEFSKLDAERDCDLKNLAIMLRFRNEAVSAALPRTGTLTIALDMNGDKTSYDLSYEIDGEAGARYLSLNGPSYSSFHKHLFGVLAGVADGISAEAEKRKQDYELKSSFSFNFTAKDGSKLVLMFPVEGISAADFRRVLVTSSCGESGR